MKNIMEKNSFFRCCAFSAAAGYLIAGVTHFLMPAEQIHFAKGISAQFFASFSSGSVWFVIHYWAFVYASVSVLGVVLGLSSKLRLDSLMQRLATVLASAGLIITAVDFAMMQAYALRMADKFSALGPDAQAAIIASGLPHLDLTGLFGFGFVGFWSFIANMKIVRDRELPRGLGLLGIFGVLFYEAAFFGSLLHIPVLTDIGAAIGGILIAPAWFIWSAIAYGKMK
jgi:hypothetical protein